MSRRFKPQTRVRYAGYEWRVWSDGPNVGELWLVRYVKPTRTGPIETVTRLAKESEIEPVDKRVTAK